MIEVAHEPRVAVMIVVEVSWVDQRGTLQAGRARMENKSAGGACIRIRTPIELGSKLKIQWRWEQFSGIAKYCLSDRTEYLVGIQRDTKKSAVVTRPVPTASPVRNGVRSSDPPVSYKIQSPPKLESKPSEITSPNADVINGVSALPSARISTPPTSTRAGPNRSADTGSTLYFQHPETGPGARRFPFPVFAGATRDSG